MSYRSYSEAAVSALPWQNAGGSPPDELRDVYNGRHAVPEVENVRTLGTVVLEFSALFVTTLALKAGVATLRLYGRSR